MDRNSDSSQGFNIGMTTLSKLIRFALILSLAFFLIGCGSSSKDRATSEPPAPPPVQPPAVYILTNDGEVNAIQEYRRNSNGTLSLSSTYPTGGNGSGDDLGSPGNALSFDPVNNHFYAVNAGSDSITAMALGPDGKLSTLDTVDSGSIRPVSVTASGDLIYVLHAGDSNTPASIDGFRLVDNKLQALAGSHQTLSAPLPNPTQIQFTPSGSTLVVTEPDSNKITTFTIGDDGTAALAASQDSPGATPSGFDLRADDLLVVAEAQQGTADKASISSAEVTTGGQLNVISPSVENSQTGSRHLVVGQILPYVYVSNFDSDSLSLYALDDDGTLTLMNGNIASTGTGPRELAISNDGLYLYVHNSGDDSLSIYTITSDGALSSLTGVGGLPSSSVGLVAR